MPNGNGGAQNNPHASDFEARVQFLLQSSESLRANLQATRNSQSATNKWTRATENLLAIVRSHQGRLDKLEGDNQ